MSSNDERAQSGDTIEITTHLRNDLGKRMQVSTSDGLSVVAMDNRMRVTVAHGDYKVVKRCGRPAVDEAPKKRGRPSNAELAARAAAERTPPAVVLKAPKVEPKAVVVTDADVAGLEKALEPKSDVSVDTAVIASVLGFPTCECGDPPIPHLHTGDESETTPGEIDVPVTRKVEQSLADPRPNIPHDQVMTQMRDMLAAKKQPSAAQAKATAEFERATGIQKPQEADYLALDGDLIELLTDVGAYPKGDWLEVAGQSYKHGSVIAVGGKDGDDSVVVLSHQYRVVKRAADMAAEAKARSLQFAHLTDGARWHLERIHMEAAGDVALATLTQEQIDAMTTHTEPRGFIAPDLPVDIDPLTCKPEGIVIRKHSHYFKDVSQFDVIDVYRVLERFNVTDQAIGHALKKLLVAGGRGHKDIGKDVQEAIDTLVRWQDMRAEEAAA